MPDADAEGLTQGRGDTPGADRPAPRLYSLTTRYVDLFLEGEDGPDLLCDDPIAALHFALTVSTSSPLAVTCATSTDGHTWTPLTLQGLRTDADRALQHDVKPRMYTTGVLDPFPQSRPRPLVALRRLVDQDLADWLDAVLRQVDDDGTAWADETTQADWIRAGRLWAAVWGEPPTDSVLGLLTTTPPAPSIISRNLMRGQADAVTNAVALAHDPAEHGLADLHDAWLLLHELDEWTMPPQYRAGTDLRAPLHRLQDRIAALHPDTATPLAATRDHSNAPAVQAAAHAYLRAVLPLWPDATASTDRARAHFLDELDTLSTPASPPPEPPEGAARKALRTALAPLDEPAALSHHQAAALWRSRSNRAAEQASWDMATHANRVDDLARAYALEGTPQEQNTARRQAQQNLVAVSDHHSENLRTHAARGHLHKLSADHLTLDRTHRALQTSIWDIYGERRAQHDPASGAWNGYDEQRTMADLGPVLADGEAQLDQLRRRHLDLTRHAVTQLLPQLAHIPPADHRNYTIRKHLAPLDLLGRDLRETGPLIDSRRRACDELRARLESIQSFGRRAVTAQDLARAEADLQQLQQRYADIQTEFALSVRLGRAFDQMRTPSPPEASPVPQRAADVGPRRSRHAKDSQAAHEQATAAALRNSPSMPGR
ncbi:hypothetical protein [Streptomyces sp. NBC_00470]|uniref:hypothetical protein n=1 Tax=Streptomyces sp. NBC_00470 TaxID=2975753 RepID=UPI002F91BEDD